MGPTGCRRHEPKDFQFRGNRWVVPLRKSLIAAILTFLATFNGPTVPAFAHQVPVRVMTQNMYLGADFSVTPVRHDAGGVRCSSNADLPKHLGVETSGKGGCRSPRNRERASRCHSTVGGVDPAHRASAPATDVESDQLEALLGELRRLGQHYEAVAILPNLDVEAPTLLGFDARLTDRTVIIARAGVPGLGPEARKYAGSGLPREPRA